MTHRQLITKVLRERGFSERDIRRRITNTQSKLPINADEHLVFNGISEEEGIKLMSADLHETFDKIDASPKLQAAVGAEIARRIQKTVSNQ